MPEQNWNSFSWKKDIGNEQWTVPVWEGLSCPLILSRKHSTWRLSKSETPYKSGGRTPSGLCPKRTCSGKKHLFCWLALFLGQNWKDSLRKVLVSSWLKWFSTLSMSFTATWKNLLKWQIPGQFPQESGSVGPVQGPGSYTFNSHFPPPLSDSKCQLPGKHFHESQKTSSNSEVGKQKGFYIFK